MALTVNPLSAWVDESVSHGAYTFGAVILRSNRVVDARDQVAPLRKPAENKVHWHALSTQRRNQVVRVLASLPITTLVVVRVSDGSERQERQRRKCLELLLPALVGNGVDIVTLESRGNRDDQRDRDLLAAMQAQLRISGPALRMDHVRGVDEPLLWLADALCGAFMNARKGDDRWWQLLEISTNVLTFDAKNP